jgi:uncharacterized membrane protein
VVGQVVSNVGGVQKTSAFLWDSAHGLSFLPDFGNASRAYGINNLGQIVGQACKEDYFPVLWEPVPEPSSIICLAGGLVGLLEIRRRWAR